MADTISSLSAASAPKPQVIKGVSNKDAALVSGTVATGAGLFTIMRAVDRSIANGLRKEADAMFTEALKSGKKFSELPEEMFRKGGQAVRINKGSGKHIIFGTLLTLASGLFAKYCYDRA